MIHILGIVMPIFLIMAVGFVLKRTGMMDGDFISSANRLIYHVFLPVLVFEKIARSNFTELFNPAPVGVLLGTILIMSGLGFLYARMLKIPTASAATFTNNVFRANYAYIGLPVCFYALGEEGLALASILLAFVVPLVNVLSIITMNLGRLSEIKIKTLFAEVLGNPIVLAALAGIAFVLSGWQMHDILGRTLSTLSSVTLPLALLAMGAAMNINGLRGNVITTGSAVVMKLILFPLITYILLNMVNGSLALWDKVVILMGASPSAMVNYVLSVEMDGDSELANSIIVGTTIVSIITFAVWMHLLGVD